MWVLSPSPTSFNKNGTPETGNPTANVPTPGPHIILFMEVTFDIV